MSKDRITPCLYYKAIHECSKGRDAEHNGYCQKCNKYKPRAKVRYLNIKKQKLRKLKEKERY